MNISKNEVMGLRSKIIDYIERDFMIPGERKPYSGVFSLLPNRMGPDLYGMMDALYILYVTGMLKDSTTETSRKAWAEAIIDCQDEEGWFSKRNLRGHSREHATAYAISSLRLLEITPGESYVSRIRPIAAVFPVLIDRSEFERWISRLDFRLSLQGILEKKLGWHYIWRGSHIGGGMAAIVGMVSNLFEIWWPDQIDLAQWFSWYFEWLDAQASSKTGYWQRACWNHFFRQPTLIDMGGAVHFFWIYEAMDRPFPHPEATIESTLKLQKAGGLYKDYPFCIDLDGNYCLIRSYLQLSEERKSVYRDRVYDSVEHSFEAIVEGLTEKPLEEIYQDSHGLPGALAALVECAKLPNFKYANALKDWQHPLDKAWWL